MTYNTRAPIYTNYTAFFKMLFKLLSPLSRDLRKLLCLITSQVAEDVPAPVYNIINIYI